MNELRLPKPVPLGPRTYAIVSAAVLGAATGAPLVNSMMQIKERNALMAFARPEKIAIGLGS